MVDIKLKDGQSGYSVIGDYIRRYWNYNVVDTVIVSIAVSHDGHNYYFCNLIASPIYSCNDDIEFLDDWWEGEEYIKLFGIKTINEVDISGGIHTEE